MGAGATFAGRPGAYRVELLVEDVTTVAVHGTVEHFYVDRP